MSPDWSKTPEGVPYADLSNPQSLNLYSYVKNNPLSHLDIDGHGELWDKFKAIFFAKVDVGVGVKAEVDLGRHFKAGASAFAGGEKKFSSEGSKTTLKAEASVGAKAGPADAEFKKSIEKQIQTNGNWDPKPAEVQTVTPSFGGEAAGGSGEATPNELSVTLALPDTETPISLGGSVGMDLDKGGEFLDAVGKTAADAISSTEKALVQPFVKPAPQQ